MMEEKAVVLNFKEFKEGVHWEMIKEWFEHYEDWKGIDKAILPDFGLVCTADDVPVCAGWCYFTNSVVMWMEWVVCDPKAPKEIRGKALDALINKLCEEGASRGHRAIFTQIKIEAFEKRLQRLGFTSGDRNMIHMVKGV